MKVFIIDSDVVIEADLIGKYLKPTYSYRDTFEDDYTYQVELSNHVIIERSKIFTDKEIAEKQCRAEVAQRQIQDINRKKEELEKALRLFNDNNKLREIDVDLTNIQASIEALSRLKLENKEQ